MTWTKFMDMHSGGGNKVEPYDKIYIEAPEKRARAIFIERFDQDPFDIACECCGENFSVSEYATLDFATQYERQWGKETELADYIKRKDVLIISEADIAQSHRTTTKEQA